MKVLAADERARYLGGGTLAVRAWNAGDASIGRFVLSDGLGLERIRIADGRSEIGSAATMAEIAAHPGLSFLHEVAGSIGGPAVRAMATVGGNLFTRPPYGDFTVALLALDAGVQLSDAGGAHEESLEAFLARERRRDEIVRAVDFAFPPEGGFRFAKVVRTHPHGGAVLSIAAVLPVEGGLLRGARIAFGGMGPRPMRAHAVEAALEGRALDASAAEAAAAVALAGCAPMDDPFASAWYRAAVLPAHLKRLLAS